MARPTQYGDRRIDTKLPERFWRQTVEGPVPQHRPDLGHCLFWTGTLGSKGYGIWGKGTAHRAVYEDAHGPVPDLDVDHLCRVRHCVRPEHLEAVTCRENLLRSPLTLASQNARKTHCPKGHAYDATNTYIGTAGRRHCRTCRRIWARRARAEGRA